MRLGQCLMIPPVTSPSVAAPFLSVHESTVLRAFSRLFIAPQRRGSSLRCIVLIHGQPRDLPINDLLAESDAMIVGFPFRRISNRN
jgi:hypothetical protein